MIGDVSDFVKLVSIVKKKVCFLPYYRLVGTYAFIRLLYFLEASGCPSFSVYHWYKKGGRRGRS